MKIRRSARVVQILLAGLFTASAGTFISPASAGTGSSLRVMTYNTAFMIVDVGFPVGEINTNDGKFGDMSYSQRAVAIANAVLAGDNDVVAFNEVFSTEAKDILVQNLKAKYPYYIRQVKGEAPNPWADLAGNILQFVPDGLKPATLDSGLMLFSKYPFVPFSANTAPMQVGVKVVDGVNGNTLWGASPYEVSVFTYIANTHDDGLASKSVAMVRIKNPNDQQISNVAFTHMQADKKPGDAGVVRAEQFQNIEKLIKQSLTSNERATQAVYVIGDLNVIGGNYKVPSSVGEWEQEFQATNNATGGFFSCGNNVCDPDHIFMTDSFGFETSTKDPGISNNVDNARLDYILHNKPNITNFTVKPIERYQLCMQYIAKANEITAPTQGGAQQLSDHLGVRADFNKAAKACSPNDKGGALGPVALNFSNAQNLSFSAASGAKITFPGSMQWYRIDQPGSYSIKLSGVNAAHLGFEVYAGRDLSTPLPPFYNEVNKRYGPKYFMPETPYYVRVFAKDPNSGKANKPDRNWKGDYSIAFHQYRGTSPDDAMLLGGGLKLPYSWPGPNQLEYPQVWFSFHTKQADSGKYPDIDFLHDVAVGQDTSLFDLALHDDVIVNGLHTYPQINFTGVQNYTDPNTLNPGVDYSAPDLDGINGKDKLYYLTLTRDQFLLKNTPMTTWLTFGTTMTYLKPITITSLDMDDDWPDRDNIELQFNYDGPWQKTACSGADCLGPIPFGTDAPYALNGFAPFKKSFSEQVIFNLWKEGKYFADYIWSNQPVGVSALMQTEGPCHSCSVQWADGGNVDDADFWYEMTYSISHDATDY